MTAAEPGRNLIVFSGDVRRRLAVSVVAEESRFQLAGSCTRLLRQGAPERVTKTLFVGVGQMLLCGHSGYHRSFRLPVFSIRQNRCAMRCRVYGNTVFESRQPLASVIQIRKSESVKTK